MAVHATIDGMKLDIEAELVRKYDCPLPRYTSYPPAPVWRMLGAEDYAAALRGQCSSGTEVSLYVHIPFCRTRCAFCGCSAIATTKSAVIDRLVCACVREIELVAATAGARMPVAQIHFGGGTPLSAGVEGIANIVAAVRERCALASGAEIAIELDPRSVQPAEVARLARIGVTRMSFGVQDFDPEVGELIGRRSDPNEMGALVTAARRAGIGGINIDLVYGLPGQRAESWEQTLAHVIAIAPDRIAVFNFAYLPRQLSHQRRLDAARLPAPMEKLALFAAAAERLGEAGYAFIGLDHFARRGDRLEVAHREGKLTRNFQGYAAGAGAAIVGVGPTAISELGGLYAQNEKKLARYLGSVEAGRFATCRGIALAPDDERRRRAIRQLLCSQRAPILDEEVRRRLTPLAADGLVAIEGDEIRVTPLGRLFVRHAAAAFDATLDPRHSPYSRAV